jgi:CheY-like chemotaxis protein
MIMNNQEPKRETLIILLVEDNPAHAELVRRNLQGHPIFNNIFHVSNGEVALDYLFRRGAYTDPAQSPRPHLILLDLRLPRIDGLEVLKEIKTTSELKRIPVVILTTSAAEQDVNNAYDQHANSYLVKPVNSDNFTRLMNDLGFYWLEWNHQPSL